MADGVSPGEEFVRAKAGEAIPSVAMKKRIPGIDKGKIWIAKDFNILSERELDEWYAARPPLNR
jgi:hypothetical protein